MEDSAIWKVLSKFLVRVSNPDAGNDTPVEVNVPMQVFGQKLGKTIQAGKVRRVVSVMK